MLPSVGPAQTTKLRLRDYGIRIGRMSPGPWNAVTDVPGVRVGHTTLVSGTGPLVVGHGPVRTGVTAIIPHEGSIFQSMIPAAIAVLNGAGEITGRSQVDEYGLIETPILVTNTLSVGAVHQACVEWLTRREPSLGTGDFVIPVVAETFDGWLNDTAGQHVKREHVFAALDSAESGPVLEGNVGGGTGMTLYGFKGGVGTSSRVVAIDNTEYTVGVIVQGNYGRRRDLLIDGVPLSRELLDFELSPDPKKDGSIIVTIATNAPLSERQLARLCRRGMLGLGRIGAAARHTSGDLLIAFSNAPENRVPRENRPARQTLVYLDDEIIDDLFSATIEATAEAVLNAMVAADTMIGRDDHLVPAMPMDLVLPLMRAHGRVANLD